MNIIDRNSISDSIKYHIEKVGLDEITEELVNLAELCRGVLVDDSNKTTEFGKYKQLISRVRLETILDTICIFTGKNAFIDNNYNFTLMEKD